MTSKNASNIRRWLLSLDTYANATYGRCISSAVVANRCVSCDRDIGRSSPKGGEPYAQVGLCDRCQRDQEHAVPADTVVPFKLPQAQTS